MTTIFLGSNHSTFNSRLLLPQLTVRPLPVQTETTTLSSSCEFWGFHGGDISSRGLLGCDAV